MIQFKHKLPCMHAEGRQNGSYNNEEAGLPGIFTTKDTRLGEFMHQLRNDIWDDRRLVFVDGRMLMCSKNWIRDHVHEMKGYMHWEYDLQSFINFILENQTEEGFFYELIKQYDDYHWTFVNEDCYKRYDEDNVVMTRLELEADVEYLVVEGVRQIYKVTGDDEWLAWALPKLEKGIHYMLTSPKRWDKEHGLIKRPFTIDTWDFIYGVPTNNRKIESDTPMSIMHGDNSGVYQAMMQLAWMNRHFQKEDRAKYWEERAEKLKENMFKYLWNGKFFIHQLHLNHKGADDREWERLSLSNAYDINRGVTSIEQARSIIKEYQKRRETTAAFAEWFSIDPPYENFCSYKPGEYVNGAISPFTAGELAKAAFRNGFEQYGWNIIQRFIDMYAEDRGIFFLYSPHDRSPQNDSGPSAWGAAAILSAIDEGLAGIVDAESGYQIIEFSPRFPVTDYTELRYTTGYEKSAVLVDVRYILTDEGLRYDIKSPAYKIKAHILLPEGKKAARVLVNDWEQMFAEQWIGGSFYINFDIEADKYVSIQVLFS